MRVSDDQAIPPTAGGGANRRFWLIIALVIAAAHVDAPALAQAGLDGRPSNTTCLAAPLAAGPLEVRGVRAFAPLVFSGPTQVRQGRTEPDRFYVAERRGVIRTFRDNGGGAEGDRVALDIRDRMQFTPADASASEQWGISSFVLAPDFGPDGGFMYVAYNRRPAPDAPVRSSVSRFASTNGLTFDPASETELLSLAQDRPWHHIGQLQFGSDGALYVGSGDGGTRERSQDSRSLHGKILRIDLDARPPAITQFASGVRNPWRFSFSDGQLWVADVGWNTWEEITRIPLGDASPANLGWPIYEGNECLIADLCRTPGLTPPTHVFGHDIGSAVIGGLVYRGSQIPALRDHYVFGVASNPELFALTPTSGYTRRIKIGQLPTGRSTGLFRGSDNELYVNDTFSGAIWRLVPASPGANGAEVASRLSETGCMSAVDNSEFAPGVVRYAVNMPLWSDGLGKRRGVALPNDAAIAVDDASGDFALPAGTVLLKSFFLDDRIVETRLFMNHPGATGGWRGYSYEWDASDASLLETGKTRVFTTPSGPVTWLYPSREQCFQCHTPAAGTSLGLELAQIDRDFTYASTGRTANQLDTWRAIGMFDGPVPRSGAVAALATRTTGSVTRRARSYLHANCSFCHRPGGNARVNIDFRFGRPAAVMNVCNVPASGELLIPGTDRLMPGDPRNSMLWLRMNRRDVHQMPPLGTFVIDSAMVETVGSWIRTPGVCD
jgi:uncharacterized repeat protein (TIGR03806 family)